MSIEGVRDRLDETLDEATTGSQRVAAYERAAINALYEDRELEAQVYATLCSALSTHYGLSTVSETIAMASGFST